MSCPTCVSNGTHEGSKNILPLSACCGSSEVHKLGKLFSWQQRVVALLVKQCNWSITGQAVVKQWSSSGQRQQCPGGTSCCRSTHQYQHPVHCWSNCPLSLSLSWRQLLPEEQWSVAAAAILAALPSADQRPPAPVVPLGYRADHRPPANGCPASAAPYLPLASIQGSSYPR